MFSKYVLFTQDVVQYTSYFEAKLLTDTEPVILFSFLQDSH